MKSDHPVEPPSPRTPKGQNDVRVLPSFPDSNSPSSASSLSPPSNHVRTGSKLPPLSPSRQRPSISPPPTTTGARKSSKTCEECEVDSPELFCRDCDQNLCMACAQTLHKAGRRKNHPLVSVTDGSPVKLQATNAQSPPPVPAPSEPEFHFITPEAASTSTTAPINTDSSTLRIPSPVGNRSRENSTASTGQGGGQGGPQGETHSRPASPFKVPAGGRSRATSRVDRDDAHAPEPVPAGIEGCQNCDKPNASVVGYCEACMIFLCSECDPELHAEDGQFNWHVRRYFVPGTGRLSDTSPTMKSTNTGSFKPLRVITTGGPVTRQELALAHKGNDRETHQEIAPWHRQEMIQREAEMRNGYPGAGVAHGIRETIKSQPSDAEALAPWSLPVQDTDVPAPWSLPVEKPSPPSSKPSNTEFRPVTPPRRLKPTAAPANGGSSFPPPPPVAPVSQTAEGESAVPRPPVVITENRPVTPPRHLKPNASAIVYPPPPLPLNSALPPIGTNPNNNVEPSGFKAAAFFGGLIGLVSRMVNKERFSTIKLGGAGGGGGGVVMSSSGQVELKVDTSLSSSAAMNGSNGGSAPFLPLLAPVSHSELLPSSADSSFAPQERGTALQNLTHTLSKADLSKIAVTRPGLVLSILKETRAVVQELLDQAASTHQVCTEFKQILTDCSKHKGMSAKCEAIMRDLMVCNTALLADGNEKELCLRRDQAIAEATVAFQIIRDEIQSRRSTLVQFMRVRESSLKLEREVIRREIFDGRVNKVLSGRPNNLKHSAQMPTSPPTNARSASKGPMGGGGGTSDMSRVGENLSRVEPLERAKQMHRDRFEKDKETKETTTNNKDKEREQATAAIATAAGVVTATISPPISPTSGGATTSKPGKPLPRSARQGYVGHNSKQPGALDSVTSTGSGGGGESSSISAATLEILETGEISMFGLSVDKSDSWESQVDRALAFSAEFKQFSDSLASVDSAASASASSSSATATTTRLPAASIAVALSVVATVVENSEPGAAAAATAATALPSQSTTPTSASTSTSTSTTTTTTTTPTTVVPIGVCDDLLSGWRGLRSIVQDIIKRESELAATLANNLNGMMDGDFDVPLSSSSSPSPSPQDGQLAHAKAKRDESFITNMSDAQEKATTVYSVFINDLSLFCKRLSSYNSHLRNVIGTVTQIMHTTTLNTFVTKSLREYDSVIRTPEKELAKCKLYLTFAERVSLMEQMRVHREAIEETSNTLYDINRPGFRSTVGGPSKDSLTHRMRRTQQLLVPPTSKLAAGVRTEWMPEIRKPLFDHIDYLLSLDFGNRRQERRWSDYTNREDKIDRFTQNHVKCFSAKLDGKPVFVKHFNLLHDAGRECVARICFTLATHGLHYQKIAPLTAVAVLDDGESVVCEFEHFETSLEDWMKAIGKKRTLTEVHPIVISLCMAVAKCHENGVAHRNIKASNIMMDDGNNPLLTDFDHSVVFPRVSSDSKTEGKTGETEGTSNGDAAQAQAQAAQAAQAQSQSQAQWPLPVGAAPGLSCPIESLRGYMAPELVSADGSKATPKSEFAADVWALGCVVWQLFNSLGSPHPRLPEDFVAYQTKQIPSEKNRFVCSIQPVVAFINRMLEIDPDKRATVADCVKLAKGIVIRTDVNGIGGNDTFTDFTHQTVSIIRNPMTRAEKLLLLQNLNFQGISTRLYENVASKDITVWIENMLPLFQLPPAAEQLDEKGEKDMRNQLIAIVAQIFLAQFPKDEAAPAIVSSGKEPTTAEEDLWFNRTCTLVSEFRTKFGWTEWTIRLLSFILYSITHTISHRFLTIIAGDHLACFRICGILRGIEQFVVFTPQTEKPTQCVGFHCFPNRAGDSLEWIDVPLLELAMDLLSKRRMTDVSLNPSALVKEIDQRFSEWAKFLENLTNKIGQPLVQFVNEENDASMRAMINSVMGFYPIIALRSRRRACPASVGDATVLNFNSWSPLRNPKSTNPISPPASK